LIKDELSEDSKAAESRIGKRRGFQTAATAAATRSSKNRLLVQKCHDFYALPNPIATAVVRTELEHIIQTKPPEFKAERDYNAR
jgi:hypothetical protein